MLIIIPGESATLSVENRNYTFYCSWRNVSLFGVLWFTEKELWVIYVLFYSLYIFIHCNDIYYFQDVP